VQTSFVTESIKQGHLLDPNDFVLGDASSFKKPNRSGRRPTSFRDMHSPESDHAISVTPEPPAAVQSKNGFRFTPAEMTYTWALIRRIITKDPLKDKIKVAKALHNKVSWPSTFVLTVHLMHIVR
jgi:hypothetical protein